MTQDEGNIASRAALLDAAKRLFSQRSFDAVSTRELAESAGVNLGAIQYHFGSKAKLFVQAIADLMQDEGCTERFAAFGENIDSREEAAERLCLVILLFLDDILHTDGPQPCRIMFREIFSDSEQTREISEALVSAAVRDFMGPIDEMLVTVLEKLCPESSPMELQHAACSIVGQCSFYVTHAPFVSRLRGYEHGESPYFESTVKHIAEFSLRALGCTEELIRNAIATALSDESIRAVTPAVSNESISPDLILNVRGEDI